VVVVAGAHGGDKGKRPASRCRALAAAGVTVVPAEQAVSGCFGRMVVVCGGRTAAGVFPAAGGHAGGRSGRTCGSNSRTRDWVKTGPGRPVNSVNGGQTTRKRYKSCLSFVEVLQMVNFSCVSRVE
jgi:hypothetical protein